MRQRQIFVLVVLLAIAAAGCDGGDGGTAVPTATVGQAGTATGTPSVTTTPGVPTPTVTITVLPTFAVPTLTPTELLPSVTPTQADPLIVATDKGPVQGSTSGGVRSFFGIPYAAPPVGELRWRPPQPHAGWTEARDATKAGSVCVQKIPVINAPVGSEDCLFVNVQAPDPPPPQPVPVMVWIHGGGFTSGDGLQANGGTDGAEIVRRSGVVVVSLNYRLGQFGFLAHPLLSAEDASHPASGNYGIEDQIAALQWVQANIAAFGGDPGNVTIFGESAGGWSVCAHLASPRSAGLFHRAMIQSGPCAQPLASLAAAERQGEAVAAALGCGGAADVLSCMRARPATEVRDALPPDPAFAFTEGEWGSWMPVLDGFVLTAQFAESFAGGDFNHVPVVAGSTRDEGTLFVAISHDWFGTPLTAEQYPERLRYLLGSDTLVDQVVARYPIENYADPGAALAAAFGDGFLACPTIETAAALAPHVPSYLYQFEYPDADFAVPLPVSLGAFHSAEVQFVFGRPTNGPGSFTPAEADLSDQMMGYWTRFAAGGDPNGLGAVPWPRLDQAGRHILFDVPVVEGQGAKAEACEFWRTLDYLRPQLTE